MPVKAARSRPPSLRAPDGSRERSSEPGRTAPNERQLLFALALIDVVGEQGYRESTVAQVVARAGLSRSAFYAQFANKQECLLFTFDLVAEELLRRVDHAYRAADGWPNRVEAAIRALFEAAIENPGALRIGLLEMSAVGPAGIERRKRATTRYERFIGDALALAPGEGAVSSTVLSALVGGMNRVLYRRVMLGRGSDPTLLISDLVRWMTSYYPTPPALLDVGLLDGKRAIRERSDIAALEGGRAPGTLAPHALLSTRRGLPRGDQGLSRSFVVHNQRERILDAVANLTAADGYAELRVEDVAERAAVSLQAFYEHFLDKEDALLVAYEIGHAKGLAITERAYAAQADWRLGVRAGLTALLQFLATEPSFAHVALIDALIASPRTAERAEAGIAALAMMVVPSIEEAPGMEEPPGITIEAIAAGIFELCLSYVLENRTAELPQLAPIATYLALAPFLDADEAAAIATGPVS